MSSQKIKFRDKEIDKKEFYSSTLRELIFAGINFRGFRGFWPFPRN